MNWREREHEIERLEKLANQGDVKAQFKLGCLYESDGDENNAILWFEKAANQGHLRAQRALAHTYGCISSKLYNPKKSFEWYKKVADQGDMGAIEEVGRSYYFGVGVMADKKKAIEYLTIAAENGSKVAQELLESEKNHPIIYSGIGRNLLGTGVKIYAKIQNIIETKDITEKDDY
ncbi:MAG: sel1 repeat family protein [Ruminococcus sp.]|nr:sel1 repeat family protein [Ruminococcus sp.]